MSAAEFQPLPPMPDAERPFPPIADYALIGNCRGTALVSRQGAIDWCCLPDPDSPSCFGRLLDRARGGTCRISPVGEAEITRRYLEGMVLETTFRTADGVVRVVDSMTMPADPSGGRILRVVQGVEGSVPMRAEVRPRLEYGAALPWVRRHGVGLFTATGGHVGLVIWGSLALEAEGDHDLVGESRLDAGETRTLAIAFVLPESIDTGPPPVANDAALLEELGRTIDWWSRWSQAAAAEGRTIASPEALRSAAVLKALSYAPTGAFVAAATTSLPEALGAGRNWDYRFSWVRDSAFAVRALVELGFRSEAEGFRRFVERTTAGGPGHLQPVYGVRGEIRLPESTLDELEGHRGSRPVRIGNGAYSQLQLDVYGYVLDLAWQWHERGAVPSTDYWRFLSRLVDSACEQWSRPDRGLWEVRGEPQHFVHSKVMCWSALDCGVRLAERLEVRAPLARWSANRDEVRRSVEARGYDPSRGVFTRAFDRPDLDSALLLLPWVGFVAHDDPRMIRTTDAVWKELGMGEGLLRRYAADDGLEGTEGAFLPCTFWLAECLARQGRAEEAGRVFEAGAAAANDVGLFSEECDPRTGDLLGNFPQALTHLSHISALRALAESNPQFERPAAALS